MKNWLGILSLSAGLALAGSACSSNPLAEGQRQMAAGEYAQAVETFKALQAQSPQDPRVLNELGLAYAKQEKNQEAEQAYQKALKLDPAFPEAHFNLGTVYLRQMGLAEAEAEFRLALKNRPDYVKAYNNLGLALMEMGKFDEAEQNFKKAIELDSSDAMYKENLQYCQSLGKSTKENLKGLSEEKRKKEIKGQPAEKPKANEKPTGKTPAAAPKAPSAP